MLTPSENMAVLGRPVLRATGDPERDVLEYVHEVERRDALLEAVVIAAERFLRSSDLETHLPQVLAQLGKGAAVSRVYVFQNHEDEQGRLLTSQRFEWVAPGCPPHIDNPELQGFSMHELGFGRWVELLADGGIVEGLVRSFPAPEQEFLKPQDILSLAIVPIFAEGLWWGFIGFDDCDEEREWPPATLAVLQTAARLLGAALERARADARLEESERRFHLLADATREGILIHDGTVVLDANPSVLAMLGCGEDEVIGRSPFDFLSAESREVAIEHALAGHSDPYEVIGLRRDGTRFPAELKGGEILFGNRRARFVSVLDLTQRKLAEDNQRRLLEAQAARAEAEAGRARAQLLAEASRVLSSSFDYQTTLARVARLAVPYLADYCVIDMVEAGRLRRVTTAAAEAATESLVHRLMDYVPDLAWSENPIVAALQSGEPLLVRDVDDIPPAAVARAPEHLALLRRLRPRSAMFVPVTAGAGVLGVITLVATDATRQFTAEDLALADNLAGRTGLAIHNAQLFHQAQQASRARDEVLSVVAHDLRNPLGVIRNGAELLGDSGLEEGQRRFTRMILRAADGMNRLIGDLLEITRIETGSLRLERGAVRVGTLVEEAAAMLEPLAAARQITLEVRVHDPDVEIQADAGRLNQVLSNLVGNALKFTPPGGRVLIRSEALGDEARFAVIDTGPGVKPEEIPHIFGRFWQADRRDDRGVGLGLAIAKGLVEEHGGRIWVESTAGEGARFYFTIPSPG
jgi:PAS domain S-box-containing protein